jgi:hypothetical protein
MILTGERKRKTCPSATLNATNPTWTGLASKPGIRGKRPSTNHWSHGISELAWKEEGVMRLNEKGQLISSLPPDDVMFELV